MRYAWAGALSWGSFQSPVTHSCGLLNHLNSFLGGYSSLRENLMQIHCSTHSVILNVMATQYTCSLYSLYRPHWLVQRSSHRSHKHIPVQSSWLPGYIDVMQTVLIILTMAELLSRQTYYILIHFLSPPKYHDCPPIVALICLVTNSWTIEHLAKLKHQSFS